MNIIDTDNLLTDAQKNMLQDKANLYFKLGRYKSLNDILEKLNIDVIIERGIHTMQQSSYFIDAYEYWMDQEYRQRRGQYIIDFEMEMGMYEEPSMSETERSLETRMAESLDEERQVSESQKVRSWARKMATTPIRGLYVPTDKKIILFPEEMKEEYNGAKIDELLLSTLAHETMHAYFDRKSRTKHPYVMFVEEPLAEFGMLLYYYETQNPDYQWSLQDVADKNNFYRYGALLMLQHRRGDQTLREYLKEYKIPLKRYELPKIATRNGRANITLPKTRTPQTIDCGGQIIEATWHKVFPNPPKYFWDNKTKTLGLDGDWDVPPYSQFYSSYSYRIQLMNIMDAAQNLYLSRNFQSFNSDLDELTEMFTRTTRAITLPDGGRLYKK